jgi:phage portal protein BeeE/2'-5' RNA ligase
MGILKQAVGANRRAKVLSFDSIIDDTAGLDVVGWRSLTGGSALYDFYKSNQYENGYSSISKLGNGFAIIEPFTVDNNGKSVSGNILDRIYTPNTDMSAYDFREALMVCTLVHDKVLLRVHHKGEIKTSTGKIRPDDITGFTFLEGYSEIVIDGQRYYQMPNGDKFDDGEIITLKSVNPNSVTEGFSPSRAARRWTTLDDYIADFQKGFFENGAVPAGEMIVTARTVTEFNDIVDNLEKKHKGAKKNNNITYTHRPTDETGKPMNAQIEWIPFSVANKEMALKDLFENVNKKIDSVYGVPAEIRGFLSNSNYASVSVAEKIFVKYSLSPATLKIWTKFNHELNRITGGMGVAITYTLEIPSIAQEESVKATAKQTDAETIATLTDAGYTLESAISYVKTGDVEVLKIGQAKPPEIPEVTPPDEIKDTPSQPIDLFAKNMRAKQMAARDLPALENLSVDTAMISDPSLRGCIMLRTEELPILSLVTNGKADLSKEVASDRSAVPAEDTPHVTLLFGLLNNGNIWKDAVDEVLTGWSADTVTIDEVGYFTLPDSYAIVARVKPSSELIDAHERLGLLPNADTFSEYKPHITLAYINKDADLGKWITTLGEAYEGKELATAGLDYGDKPEASKGLKVKQLSSADRASYEDQLADAVRTRMAAQVENAIANYDKISKALTPEQPVDPNEDKLLSAAMLAVLLNLIEKQGDIENVANFNLILEAGIEAGGVEPFQMTPAQRKTYNSYVKKVAAGYNEQTSEKIRTIIATGREQQLTAAQIKDNLSQVLAEEWRIKRIAVSEVNRAGNESSLMSMQNIAKQTGATVEKVWEHDGGDSPCEFCKAMIGTIVPLDDNFVDLDGLVEGAEGGVFVNSFVPIQVAELHPNGHCRQTYRVIRG